MGQNITEFIQLLAACWTKSTIRCTGKGQYVNFDIPFGQFLGLLAAYNGVTIRELTAKTDSELKQLLKDHLNELINKDWKESTDAAS